MIRPVLSEWERRERPHQFPSKPHTWRLGQPLTPEGLFHFAQSLGSCSCFCENSLLMAHTFNSDQTAGQTVNLLSGDTHDLH